MSFECLILTCFFNFQLRVYNRRILKFLSNYLSFSHKFWKQDILAEPEFSSYIGPYQPQNVLILFLSYRINDVFSLIFRLYICPSNIFSVLWEILLCSCTFFRKRLRRFPHNYSILREFQHCLYIYFGCFKWNRILNCRWNILFEEIEPCISNVLFVLSRLILSNGF